MTQRPTLLREDMRTSSQAFKRRGKTNTMLNLFLGLRNNSFHHKTKRAAEAAVAPRRLANGTEGN